MLKSAMRLYLSDDLPGCRAQLAMSPEYSADCLFEAFPDTAVHSAVLIMLWPGEGDEAATTPFGRAATFASVRLGGNTEPAAVLPKDEFRAVIRPGSGDKTTVVPVDNPLLDWRVLLIRRNCYPGAHSGQIAFPGGRYEPEDADFEATARREAFEEVGVKPEQTDLAGPLTSLYVQGSNFVIHPFVAAVTPDFTVRPDAREVADYKWVPLHIFDPALAVNLNFMWSDGQERPAPAWQYEGYVIWGATAMILAELYRAVNDGILVLR